MGIGAKISSCSDDNSQCDCHLKKFSHQNQHLSVPKQNPIPTLFNIISTHYVNGYTVAVVMYPNCTNFEGKKVLVYEGNIIDELKNAKSVDPHFFDEPLSPIARFSPNINGFKALRKMLESDFISSIGDE